MKVWLLIFEHVYMTGPWSGLMVEQLVEAIPGDIYSQEDINDLYGVTGKYQDHNRHISCRLILRQAVDPESMLIVNQQPVDKPVDKPVDTPDVTTEIDYSKEGWD